MSEFGYISEAPEQSFGNNKGIFNPKDIYDLTRADKWTTVGALELIQTIVANEDSAIAFDNLFADYDTFFITFNNLSKDAGGSNYISMKFSADRGSSYTGSYPQSMIMAEAGTSYDVRTTNSGSVRIGQHGDAANTEPNNGYVYIYNFTDSTAYTFTTQHSANIINGGTSGSVFGGHAHSVAQENNYIEIKYYAGTATLSGEVSLYGVRYA